MKVARSKPCADCGAIVTKLRTDGRMEPYCPACKKRRGAESYERCRDRRAASTHKADPLNLALRDMPGFRSSLLGITEAFNG